MSCEFKTLLPHPSTAELALEAEMAQKYCRLNPQMIKALHDPWACPLEFLPWLAYAYSVDTWNDVWPESVKRTVVANSIAVHTHKGTRGGVEDALAALGVDIEIKEWWQQEPQGERGTMEATLWINTILIPDTDMIIGTAAVRDIIEQLNNSKRASIHYKFKLAAASSPITLGVGVNAQMTALQRTNAAQNNTQTHAQPAQMGMGLSGQLITLQKMEATHSHTESSPLATVWCLGMSTQLTTLHRLELTL